MLLGPLQHFAVHFTSFNIHSIVQHLLLSCSSVASSAVREVIKIVVRAVASTGGGSYTVRQTCSGKISSAVRVGCDSSLSVTFEGIVLLCDKQLPKSSPSNSFRLLIGESEKADDLTFITNNEGFLREIDVALMTAASSPKVVHLFAEEVESASAANRVPPSSSPAVKVVTS